MTTAKRACPEGASEYVQAAEKRQKTETGYSMRTFKHWVFSKLPKLSLLFTNSDDPVTASPGKNNAVPPQFDNSHESMTAWTFLKTQKPVASSTVRDARRKSIGYRKRRPLQVRPRASSTTNKDNNKYDNKYDSKYDNKYDSKYDSKYDNKGHGDNDKVGNMTARPASPLLTMTTISSPARQVIAEHDRMDARLQHLSGKLQDLVKFGQEALQQKPRLSESS